MRKGEIKSDEIQLIYVYFRYLHRLVMNFTYIDQYGNESCTKSYSAEELIAEYMECPISFEKEHGTYFTNFFGIILNNTVGKKYEDLTYFDNEFLRLMKEQPTFNSNTSEIVNEMVQHKEFGTTVLGYYDKK